MRPMQDLSHWLRQCWSLLSHYRWTAIHLCDISPRRSRLLFACFSNRDRFSQQLLISAPVEHIAATQSSASFARPQLRYGAASAFGSAAPATGAVSSCKCALKPTDHELIVHQPAFTTRLFRIVLWIGAVTRHGDKSGRPPHQRGGSYHLGLTSPVQAIKKTPLLTGLNVNQASGISWSPAQGNLSIFLVVISVDWFLNTLLMPKVKQHFGYDWICLFMALILY